jgi:peptidoglycan hydrolase-like protein with peptidoglycan-binding domain
MKKTALVLICAAFLFFGTYTQIAHADITTGLLGHWTFEEGSGGTTADSSGNNHTGTLNNGPTWQTGRVGTGALQFDGTDDSLTLATPSTLDSNTYTISFWINGSSGFSGTVFRLSNSSSDTANRSKYEIRTTPSIIIFRTGDGSSVADDDTFNTTLTAGSWWHIVCTLDGSNVKNCYRNASLISTQTNNVDITLNIPTVSFIGTNRTTINPLYNWFEGLIDDVRVYSRALSLADIQELYVLGADTEDPSIPQNLTATPSAQQVSLSWDISTDNVGVTGYNIYRDGVQINNTTQTTYTDTNVSIGNTYSYNVSAYDLEGNESNQSGAAETTTAVRTFQVKQDGSGNYTTIGGCMAAVQAGDSCVVHSGTYLETVTPTISGTYTYPILIQANGGDVVNLQSINLDQVDHVRIQNIKVQNISQHDITWTFDNYYKAGLFANEDYWILGPVTISSMIPAYDGASNGWQINPVVGADHGFDDGCLLGQFNATLVPNLPYTSTAATESIVKTISNPDSLDRVCVKTAAVLTVVSLTPTDNGSTVFRPPYLGLSKPFYSTDDLRTDLLPSLQSVGTPPALSSVLSDFEYLRMEHLTSDARLNIRPLDAYGGGHDGYSPDWSAKNHEALLRLMLNDSITNKIPALVAVTQHGIDQAHMAIDGWDDYNADGHDPGHRIFMAFAATMLDITDAKTSLLNASNMHEEVFSQTSVDGNALFGGTNSESAYWAYIISEDGSRSNVDPYGFIDGGSLSTGLSSYQNIISQSWKGSALAITLMPALQTAWPTGYRVALKNYAERFVSTGAWAQPDPCAPYDGNPANYGVTYGPDSSNPGMCILDTDLEYYNSSIDFACQAGQQCGRFPTSHGAGTDGGQNKSAFVAAMWSTYYGSIDTTSPTVTAISIPSTSDSLTISISSFTATDNTAVTGYKITESSTAPTWNVSGWSLSAPTTYTFSSAGSKTLYAWAKDAAGNISASLQDTVTITFPSSTPTPAPSGGNGAPVGLMGVQTTNTQSNTSTEAILVQLQKQVEELTVQLQDKLNQSDTNTPTYTFTRNLSLYMKGNDVLNLQKLLNTLGFTISTEGPGSPNRETTLFGLLTYRALQKFQKSVGLPATGFFGPMTRNYLNKK